MTVIEELLVRVTLVYLVDLQHLISRSVGVLALSNLSMLLTKRNKLWQCCSMHQTETSHGGGSDDRGAPHIRTAATDADLIVWC